MGARSGLFAVDVDIPKKHGGIDGRRAWQALLDKHGGCSPTRTHTTPSGGMHLLFNWSLSRPIGNSEGQLKGNNINIRGRGGYIIWSGSINADGGTYEIADHWPPANAPEWLYDLLESRTPPKPEAQTKVASTNSPIRDRTYSEAVLNAEAEKVATASEPGRNNQLNNSALACGHWIGPGRLSETEVLHRLLSSCATNGLLQDDGQAKCEKTIRSGMQAGMREPGELPDRSQLNAAPSTDKRHLPQSLAPQTSLSIHWHNANAIEQKRLMLVDGLIPQTGTGLLSGPWGMAKTFAALDLSASVMAGTEFAGHEITRSGGVLFIAAEGASEIRARLKGVVDHKLWREAVPPGFQDCPYTNFVAHSRLDQLPFAWIEDFYALKPEDDVAFQNLRAAAMSADEHLFKKFCLPLALIVVDTLPASFNLKDGNDAAEGQRMMNRLAQLSRDTGAFVLAIDHFGKNTETGTRGTSAKEAAADVVLANLGERNVEGTLSKTRMAVRKQRGGVTGGTTFFDLELVDLDNGETTCIVKWKVEEGPQSVGGNSAKPLSRSLRLFKAALQTAILDHGTLMQPYGHEGPQVRAVSVDKLRTEFFKGYPAEPDAKRKAFNRALLDAKNTLIGSYEVGGQHYCWLL